MFEAIKICWRTKEWGKGTPDVARIDKMFAMAEWLSPYYTMNALYLTQNHHFWLFRNDQGKCVMRCKEWAEDNWLSEEVVLLHSLPAGRPLLVKPDPKKVDLIGLRKTVNDAHEIFALTNTEESCWNNFVSLEEQKFESWTKYRDFPESGCFEVL